VLFVRNQSPLGLPICKAAEQLRHPFPHPHGQPHAISRPSRAPFRLPAPSHPNCVCHRSTWTYHRRTWGRRGWSRTCQSHRRRIRRSPGWRSTSDCRPSAITQPTAAINQFELRPLPLNEAGQVGTGAQCPSPAKRRLESAPVARRAPLHSCGLNAELRCRCKVAQRRSNPHR